MRYAIFSDIHGNLQAWNAIRQDMIELEADVLVCLGDVVGYGPLPEEVLTAIREVTSNFVLGNHDAAAVGLIESAWFNPDARAVIEWTRGRLSEDSREFLLKTSLTIDAGDVFFVHAEMEEPGRFGYVENADDAKRNLEKSPHLVTFIGHTHHPKIFDRDASGNVRELSDSDYRLNPAHQYIVNVGSVGEPRNPDDIRARYVIYDTESREVYFRRVDFDVDAYRRDLAATSLSITPYFLQIFDHQSAEEQYALMADMRAPVTSSGYVNQFHQAGVAQKLLLPQASGTMVRAKPRPIAMPLKKRRSGAMIAIVSVLLLLIVGLGVILMPSGREKRKLKLAVRETVEAEEVEENAEPEAEIVVVENDPVKTKSARPVAMALSVPAKMTSPTPAPPPKPATPLKPEPKPVPEPPVETVAYWRMGEDSAGDLLPDLVGAHPLKVITPGRAIKNLAPEFVPQNGASNAAALTLGLWVEENPMGAFALSPKKSFTFEGWLMADMTRGAIQIGGTQSQADGPGWRIEAKAGGNIESPGSLRFIYHGDGDPISVIAKGIDLYKPEPHHFAVIWDHKGGGAGNGKVEVYYDGTRVIEGKIPHARILVASADEVFHIGAKGNPARVAIDEIRVSAGALKPKQLLNSSSGRPAFMIDVGSADKLYKGSDSPAHADGMIPATHSTWIPANDALDDVRMNVRKVMLSSGGVYPAAITIDQGRGHGSKDPLEVDWAATGFQVIPAKGGSLFGADLMDSMGDTTGKRSVGIRVRGLEPGKYRVYFSPLSGAVLDKDISCALGVDSADEFEVITRHDQAGMQTFDYKAGTAKAIDKTWVNGVNYFKSDISVGSKLDYIVFIVRGGTVATTIPFLQIAALKLSN